MVIRCPHCRERVGAAFDDPQSVICCTACGSSFTLAGDCAGTRPYALSRKVGQFELLEELGQGSFGSVWKARDTELERFVAIKLPRRGELNSADIGRFLHEARAAAQLRHQGIVGVHEVGRGDGQVYIVSELVEGATLADWIKVKPLSIRDGAALIADVADAVHHAHGHGVIHRDLKPANILIDRQGRPRVTDFGLARREAGDVTITTDGKILGTPAYMPPEQAKGEGHQVDATGDVYSLGVILYELLTGERPFRGTTRMLVVQILNDEPPSPRRLNGAIPRDLETIVLKCLEKEPAKRYRSAEDLSADLRRFLAGAPVLARSIGRMGKLVRWSRRNKVLAVLSAVSIGLLLSVAIVSLASAIQINRARNEAIRSLEEINLLRTQEEQARKQAEANLKTAQAAVDEMLTQVGHQDLSDIPQMEPVRRALLEKALAFYQALADESGSERDLIESIGRAHGRLGDINELLGRDDEAIAAYEKAIELFESSSDQRAAGLKFSLAAGRSNLAHVYLKIGRRDEAEIEYVKAIAIWESLAGSVEAGKNLAISLSGLAGTIRETAAAERVLELQQRALAILHDLAKREPDKEPDYLRRMLAVRTNIAMALHDCGDSQAALETLRLAIGQYEDLASRIGENRDFRMDWANADLQCARLLFELGRTPEAIEPMARALDSRKRLAADFPALPKYQASLAEAYDYLARIHDELGRIEEAMAAQSEEVAIYERLVVEHESVVDYRSRLAAALNNLAIIHLDRNEPELAVPLLERAVPLQQAAFATVPDQPTYRRFLRNHFAMLADAQIMRGEHAPAARAAEEVVRLYPDSSIELYSSAVYLARCVPLAPGSVTDGYAAKAIELLNAAVDTAGADLPELERRLKSDPDLAPLRDRPGFPP